VSGKFNALLTLGESFFNRNRFLAHTLITPYFDPDFRLKEFARGAKLAAVRVSEALSRGDLSSLEGLVDNECLVSVN